jgi:hypothetical protein
MECENDIRTLKTAVDSLGKYFFPNESYSNIMRSRCRRFVRFTAWRVLGWMSVNIYRILSFKAADFGFHFSDKQMCKLG